MIGLDELAARIQEAYNDREPAAVGALYSRHARWMAADGSVVIGRAAIQSVMERFMTEAPPLLTLHELARVESGGHAVSRGTYRLSGELDGRDLSIGGAYLNVLRREDDGWRILCQQMNYDIAMIPELWAGDRQLLEDLPLTGTLLPQLAFGTQDVAADDGATAWTPDAHVALPAGGWVSGPPSISRSLRAGRRPEAGLGLVMHDLETLRVDGGLAIDIGWYELGPRGPGSAWGSYTLLARRVPRGEWLVHWLVATASPPAETPAEAPADA
ncbi:MAG TPA: nuclear transport factor 2 family protein [Acidimicrobiales bacterium]|jgi:ketosteroid isomerase-like protein|nr:nuclear transport factor 2 family protein [Acidimicrobiales bacterium]